LKVSAHLRAERLYNLDGQKGRREVPVSSGAVISWGADWHTVIQLLADPIGDACDYDLMNRNTTWVLRARFGGDGDDRHGPLDKSTVDRMGLTPARCCWGASWVSVCKLLKPSIVWSVPEIRANATRYWISRGRNNGIRIEFFSDDAAARRWAINPLAKLREGQPIMDNGRLWIEFFDDDNRLGDRLKSTVVELNEVAQIHGGRLDWI
jgi:hypothetical protein